MANNLKQIDAPQVLRSVYDTSTNCLRVCLVDGGAGSGPGVEVIIDHTTDSIRLGDGTTLFTGTTVGPKTGLDVNIITTDVDIRDLDASLDNVAIGDGTDEVSITDVGGKKGLDTNIITQDIDIRTITDTEDSISIGDGTDLLEINTDGSVNTKQFNTLPYGADYVATTFPTAVQEVYTYKTGGSGGTTVATMTITYTDSCKTSILTADENII